MKILKYLQTNPRITISEIQKMFNISRDTANRDLKPLLESRSMKRYYEEVDNPETKSDIESLKEIYFQYRLHRLKEQEEKKLSPYDVPKIVCSMAMVKTDRWL